MCGIKERARAGVTNICSRISGISSWANYSFYLKNKNKTQKPSVSSSPDLPHRVVRINWNVCYRRVHLIYSMLNSDEEVQERKWEKSKNYAHSRYLENRSIRKQILLKEQISKHKITCVFQDNSDYPRKTILFHKCLNFKKVLYHLQGLPSKTAL